MIKKTLKRAGGKSVSKKINNINDTPNFLADIRNELTLRFSCVNCKLINILDELDFIDSLIEENK